MLKWFFPQQVQEETSLEVRKMVPFLFNMNIVLFFYFVSAIGIFYIVQPDLSRPFAMAVLTTSLLSIVSQFLIKGRKFIVASVTSTFGLFLNVIWVGTLQEILATTDVLNFTVYLMAASVANSMVSIRRRQIIIYGILTMVSLTLVTFLHYGPALQGQEISLIINYSMMILLLLAVNVTLLFTSRLHHSLLSEVKEYSESLEEKVATRTRELAESNAELTRKHEEIARNLRLAQRIQQNILPNEQSYPDRRELDFGSQYHSLDAIGGDLFDILRTPGNSYGFLIADVSGHGIPAAMITTMAKVSFSSHAEASSDSAQVCSQVNQDIVRLLGGEMSHYLTAFFGILDLDSGVFGFTNAGHHPALLYNPQRNDLVRLGSPGPFLGFVETMEYAAESWQLVPDDRLLLFTDGITEAMNEDRDLYDYGRLESFIKQNRSISARSFVQKLLEDVNAFCGTRAPDDDRAVLLIHYKGPYSIEVEKASIPAAQEKKTNYEFQQQLNEAVKLTKAGYLDRALALTRPHIEEGNQDFRLLKIHATLLYKAGDKDGSTQVLNRALTLRPDDLDLKKLQYLLSPR